VLSRGAGDRSGGLHVAAADTRARSGTREDRAEPDQASTSISIRIAAHGKESALRAEGLRPGDVRRTHRTSPSMPQVLAAEGLAARDQILADRRVLDLQIDNPDRGFNYKEAGPRHADESV